MVVVPAGHGVHHVFARIHPGLVNGVDQRPAATSHQNFGVGVARQLQSIRVPLGNGGPKRRNAVRRRVVGFARAVSRLNAFGQCLRQRKHRGIKVANRQIEDVLSLRFERIDFSSEFDDLAANQMGGFVGYFHGVLMKVQRYQIPAGRPWRIEWVSRRCGRTKKRGRLVRGGLLKLGLRGRWGAQTTDSITSPKSSPAPSDRRRRTCR